MSKASGESEPEASEAAISPEKASRRAFLGDVAPGAMPGWHFRANTGHGLHRGCGSEIDQQPRAGRLAGEQFYPKYIVEYKATNRP